MQAQAQAQAQDRAEEPMNSYVATGQDDSA